MQWEDPFYSIGGTGTPTDLDIYLTDKYGNNVLGYNWNNTNSDGLEVLPFYVDGPTTVYVKVVRASTSTSLTAPLRFKYIIFRGSAEIMNYTNQNPSTIMGHSNAASAITVAAVDAAILNTGSPLAVRSYSSLGGTILTGQTENRKPDLAGPDGVQTSIVFGTGANATTNFQGTSAAAPHLAASAALLLEANNKYDATPTFLNQEAIRTTLKNAATPFNTPASGYNFESGAGFLDATKALASKFNPTPQVIEFVNITVDNPPPPGTVVIIRGQYISADSKVYFRGTEELVTTYDPAHPNQISFVVPEYSGNPDIRVYTPPKEAGNTDGQFSANALYFLTPVKKDVTVYAADTAKQYGERLPTYHPVILKDGVELTKDANGNYLASDLADLGLTNLTYNVTQIDPITGQPVPVTNLTPPGSYPIRVNVPTLDPTFNELYNYTFNELNGSSKPGH